MSKCKSNQKVKIGQLIGYNIKKNIFLKRPYTKCGGETIRRPFSKNQNITTF